jgi:molybdate transport system substrate-binding protein
MLTSVGKNIVTYGDSNEKITSYIIIKSVDAAIAWDNLGLQLPDKLDVIYLQPNQIPRLSYMSGALTIFNKDKDSAQKLLQYLTSTEGQQFFKKSGYYTTEAEAKKFAPDAQVGGIYTLPDNYTPLVK